MGFDEQSQTYFAPDYQFASDFAAQMLDQEIQPRHQAVITGTRVRARATANTQSDIIEELSWEIVKAKGPDPSTTQAFSDGQAFPWWEISLYNGKTAWVYGKYVQPLGYYRLEFGKVNGEWKLVSFPAPQ